MTSKFVQIPIVLVAVLMFCGCGNSGERGVRACFKKYQSALLKKDGKAAGASVTQNTIDYYGDVLSHVLNGSEADVNGLGLAKRMLVLQVRHSATAEELQPLSPSEFFGFMMNLDAGSGNASDVELGKISLSGNVATASVSLNGTPTPATYSFLREGENWRIDLVPQLERTEQLMEASMRGKPIAENDYMILALEKLSGRKVSADIWKPLGAK